jgi:hypothetical protein
VVPPWAVFGRGDYVNVHVEYDLAGGCAVVLDDSDAFSVYCFLYGVSYFLHDSVQVSYFVLWNLVDVLVMFFGYNKGVAYVYGLDTHERDYFVVFVDYACRRFFAHYFAEYTRVRHGGFQFYYSNTVGVL